MVGAGSEVRPDPSGHVVRCAERDHVLEEIVRHLGERALGIAEPA